MDNIKVVLWNVFHSAWTPTILSVCITMAVTLKTYSLQWYYAIPGNLIIRCLNAFLELYIIKHLTYPFNYDTNVLKLRGLTDNLEAQRGRVQDSVDDADDNNENVYKNVRKWLSDSETAIQEARVVINAKDEAAKRFLGLFPKWIARYNLSKKADEKALAIAPLTGQYMGLHPISRHPRRRQHLGQPIYYTELRLSIQKDVMEALKDPNLTRFGVRGMAGVGKSTLAKQVHSLALKDKQFDDVIFVSISEKPELGEIQKVIADGLGVKFDMEDKLVRASHLLQRINKKKTLIILDDIWQKIDLDEIGIPTGPDDKNCKILLTSRDKRILLNEMHAEKVFELQVLTPGEAHSMFVRIVPHAEDPKFDAIANEVVKKCAGMPLLIEIVAGDLRNCKELRIWEEKLHQLSDFKDEEIDLKVHESLKSSYKNLIGNEIKSFFLLAATCGQSNIQIQYLLRYCMGLGLFKERPTVSDARKRVYKLINDLQDCCLLMQGDMDGYVKLHDNVRDAALSIACGEKNAFICRSGAPLTELPDKDCITISLPFCDFREVTESNSEIFQFRCPNAELLLLLTEDISLKVSHSFFERLTTLRVLDFSGMHFAYLPSSIIFLTNLQTLCLHRCHLDEFSVIGALKQLRVLSFVDAYMIELPREIKQLTRLKVLDLSNCSKLKVIPANVFSQLTMLEELYMGNSFVGWEVEGNASLKELKLLSRLTNLEMQVQNCNMLPKNLFFNFKGLQNYRIIIGDVWDWRVNNESSKMLKLKLKTSIHSNPGVLKLLKESDDLYLDQVPGIKNVLYDLDGYGLQQLKHLHVQNDPEIQHIVNSTNLYPCPAFPNLISLFLDDLMSLESLCDVWSIAGFFNKLKSLEVRNCEHLVNLFLLSCNNQENNAKVELTRLCSLTMVNLPCLESFCNRREVDSSASHNQSTDVEGVLSGVEPSSIFNRLISLPKLENLTINTVCCAKIWKNHDSITSSNLTSLIVLSCHNLRHLFTASMVKNLSQLKRIDIIDCKQIKEIIVREEVVETKILFPKLESLRLEGLPELIRFCAGHPIGFQSLKGLHIKKCKALTTLVACTQQGNPEPEANNSSETQFLFHGKVEFPDLEELHLSNLKKLEKIWPGQLMSKSFSKLKALIIDDCHDLLTVLPPNDLAKFYTLEKLSISNCNSLQEIFQGQVLEANGEYQKLKAKLQDKKSRVEVLLQLQLRELLQNMDPIKKLKAKVQDKKSKPKVEFKLRELRISLLKRMKMIWSKDLSPVFTFKGLESVEVYHCKAVKTIFPTSIATGLSRLQSLTIESCYGVEGIVAKSESLSDNHFKFPQLTSLTLNRLPQLKCFYPGSHRAAEWPKLKCLRLTECNNAIMFGPELIYPRQEEAHEGSSQEYISDQPFFVFEKLNPNLEELTLHKTDHDNLMKVQISPNFFSKVKVLRLQSLTSKSLPAVFSFLKKLNALEKIVIDHNDLEELFSNDEVEVYAPVTHITICNAFDLKQIWKPYARLKPFTQYLETLVIYNCEWLFKIGLSASSFENLAILKVNDCRVLKSLLTVSMAKTMVNLTEMSLHNCPMITKLVENDGDQTKDEVVFNKLKTMELRNLDSLINFSSGSCAFTFPLLEEVFVYGCPLMKNFYDGVLTTPKLRSVGASKYSDNQFWEGNLNATIKYMFVESLLPQGVEDYITMSMFSGLKEHWHDQHLGRLFLNVKILAMDRCESFPKALSANLLHSLNKLTTLGVRDCRSMEEVFDLEGMSTYEGRTGLLPRLREMHLIDLPMLRNLWNNDPTKILNFRNLTMLKVENCNSLRFAFTQSVSLFLVQLQKVHIKDCQMMEGIIEMEEKQVLSEESEVLPNFRELSLDNSSARNKLDNLSLKNLRGLKVQNCSNLMHIFTMSMALCLENLEYLEVKRSSLVEYIITAADKEMTLENATIFPSLKSITLEDLPKLLSFHSTNQVLKCRSLTYIDVTHCPYMFPSTLEMEILVPPIFGGKVEFPSLKELRVELNTVKEIRFGRSGIPFFGRLKAIELTCSPGEQTVFPSDFLQNLRVLERLVISGASFEEVITHEVIAGDPILAQLKELQLCKLPNLKHLIKKDSRLALIIEQLEILQVVECGRLEVLVSLSISFQNLTALEVSECHGLVNLMTPATARSLRKLRRMVINECVMIQKIISSGTDEVEDEIHLSLLESFELNGLPRLTSFCSGMYNFNFPNLTKVIIGKCPEMETFAQGVVTTSKLSRVQTGEHAYEWEWEGNLNDTIRALSTEMRARTSS